MPSDKKKAPPRMQAPRIRTPMKHEVYQRLRALRGSEPHAKDAPHPREKARAKRTEPG